METSILVRAADCETAAAPWGGLTWYASRKQGNATAFTLGTCVIRPGCSNPLHSHPNCHETLAVLQGDILHTVEDGRQVAMGPGDVITLPPNLPHHATNVGTSDAVLLIAFSSADRQVKGE